MGNNTSETKSSRFKFNFTPRAWQNFSWFLFILLIIAVFTGGFSNWNLQNSQAVARKAVNYINTITLKGKDLKAELVGVKKQSGVYNIAFKIKGEKYNAFVSPDGNLIFPSAIDISGKNRKESQTQIPKTDKPDVKLFTMAFCPFGNQAEQGIIPVVKLLAKDVAIQPHYVIYSNYGGSDSCLTDKREFCSLHGKQELHQDIRELCVYKYFPAKYWDFVALINKNCTAKNADSCWSKYAKQLKIDAGKISKCQKGEAKALLRKEVDLNKKYKVTASPTLLINETPYQGERTSEAYKSAICSAFKKAPADCGKKLENKTSAPSGSCK